MGKDLSLPTHPSLELSSRDYKSYYTNQKTLTASTEETISEIYS